jgi:RNA polymerase sigma-70 factor (ECF subfamily)
MMADNRVQGVDRVAGVRPERIDAMAARRAAFARFTDERLARAYRLAGVILRDAVEAEDAVHDAGVQAWLHWAELRDPSKADAWFDRIVVNECRARLRRRKIAPITVTALPDRASPDAYHAFVERDALHGALARLDADHRIAVVLRHVEGLSPAEIAERTGTREGTVKSRLHYALRDLRAALEAGERLPGGRS